MGGVSGGVSVTMSANISLKEDISWNSPKQKYLLL